MKNSDTFTTRHFTCLTFSSNFITFWVFFSNFFFSTRFPTSPRNKVGKKFLYLFILGFWAPKTIWKPFCWTFPFLLHTFFSLQIIHLHWILSCLSKHFPGCVPFVCSSNFFSQNFLFFMKFEKFSFFFILHVCFQRQLVLRNLVFCLKILIRSLFKLLL